MGGWDMVGSWSWWVAQRGARLATPPWRAGRCHSKSPLPRCWRGPDKVTTCRTLQAVSERQPEILSCIGRRQRPEPFFHMEVSFSTPRRIFLLPGYTRSPVASAADCFGAGAALSAPPLYSSSSPHPRTRSAIGHSRPEWADRLSSGSLLASPSERSVGCRPFQRSPPASTAQAIA
jgi:hypothetical protein